jgi:hypothetical protein
VDLGGQVVTAEVPEGQTVELDSEEMGVLPPAPSGFAFPVGAVGVTVGGVAPGSVARVEVGFSSPVDTVRKLVGGVWERFAHDGLTGALVSADGLSATLDLQDGGRGDTDGVANGVIVDPLAPTEATSLAITTVDVPTAWLEEPYSFQLQAAGATGTVHWSVLSGSLPMGLALSDSGLVSGTPFNSMGFVRVQATDDLTSTTKLLLFGTFARSEVVVAGSPLPDGSQISIGTGSCDGAVCGTSVDFYQADGALDSLETTSVNTYQLVMGPSTLMNAAGTQVAILGWPAPTGPLSVVDADTGASVFDLTLPPGVQAGFPTFSPNGDYLTVLAAAGAGLKDVMVYDTSDWHLIRTVSSMLPVTWAPDSSAFTVSLAPSVESQVQVFSASDPSGASDRLVPLPSGPCDSGQAVDWSTTDRLLVKCIDFDGPPGGSSSLTTVSAIDGTDARVLVTNSCGPTLCVEYGSDWGGSWFSPSGQYVMMTESLSDSMTFMLQSKRVGYASDAASSPVTYLTDSFAFADGFGLMSGYDWR